MTPGSIVVVDWRDATPASSEPNKLRPAVVIGRADLFGDAFGYLLVVPLTMTRQLAVTGASIEIPPSPDNACLSLTYALTWNLQTVPVRRVRATKARISDEQLELLRNQVARLVER